MSLLFVAQIAKFGLLATSPLAARSMSKSDWGGVVIAQAIFLWTSLFVEYGFNLFGIQESAKDPLNVITQSKLAEIIYSGRLIIATLVTLIMVTLIAMGWSPLRVDNGLMISALFGGVFYGLLPVWHFQLTDRMHIIALADISIFGLATVCCLAVVATKSSPIFMLLGQTMGAVSATAFLTFILVREVGPIPIRLRSGRTGLRRARSLFIYNVSIGLYTVANLIVVGSTQGISEGAAYANSERIIRVINSITAPAVKTFFPKFAHLFLDDPRLYVRHFKQSAGIVAITFGLLTPILYFAANPIATLVYGDTYSDSGEILKILSLSVLAVNLNGIIGYFWMLPQGRNRAFNAITISGGAVNASLLFVSTRYNSFDYAWSIVFTEAFVLIMLLCQLRPSKTDTEGTSCSLQLSSQHTTEDKD
jgi:PST family polysaccharide transporter